MPASTVAGVFLFLDFLWPDPPCDRPILLTDSDSAYSLSVQQVNTGIAIVVPYHSIKEVIRAYESQSN